jgi:hypothetical protein
MTVGIWRPILLQRYDTRLADVYPKAAVSSNLTPSFTLDIELEGVHNGGLQLKVNMKDSNGKIIKEGVRKIENGM